MGPRTDTWSTPLFIAVKYKFLFPINVVNLR